MGFNSGFKGLINS